MFLCENCIANLLVFSSASWLLIVVIPCAYVQVINNVIDRLPPGRI